MQNDRTTSSWNANSASPDAPQHPLAITLVGAIHEPDRVGEVAFAGDNGTATVGRNGDAAWCRHRPGSARATGRLTDPVLSRKQVSFTWTQSFIRVHQHGRLPLTLNGRPATHADVREGDLIGIGDRYLLQVVRRPKYLAGEPPNAEFAQPDAMGWVGESATAWALRERVAFVAKRSVHVLVCGPSGSGKELVARGLHQASGRSAHALVARSAATIPESLADAELFGNLRGYPNAGMPERPGLVGEANRSTLYLDEFGELPIDIQARLLRVLDNGEYTRLGDARCRRSDLRLVAATNRDPSALKHDVLARFAVTIDVPPLQARRQDVPLIAHHLMRSVARHDREIAERFFPGGSPNAAPRMALDLVAQLITHPYTTHVRELQSLLWKSIFDSKDGWLRATSKHAPRVVANPSVQQGPVDPASLDAETVQAALDRNAGQQEATWKELGLSSRYVLSRLVRKHNLNVRGRT